MAGEAGSDSLDTGRYGINNRARNRRQMIEGGDLLRDRSVPRDKLARDVFPPDVTPDPRDARAPAYHFENGKTAQEMGTPGGPVAAYDHSHDHTYARLQDTRTTAMADADWVYPFENAEEGPAPNAGPTQWHQRIANWSIVAGASDAQRQGPVEVWTQTSIDNGATYGEWKQRAVVPPGVTSALYEVYDIVYDPDAAPYNPIVRVRLRQANDDRSPILAIPRAGLDGKIDPDWLPDATTRKPLVYADGAIPAGNTIANTSSATNFLSSYTIPAGRLAVGAMIEVDLFGQLSTDAVPPTIVLTIKVGGVVFVGTGAVSLVAAIVGLGWHMKGQIVLTAAGASGFAEAHGYAHTPVSAILSQTSPALGVAPLAVDTTAALAVAAGVQWSSASVNNTITLHTMTVRIFDLDT